MGKCKISITIDLTNSDGEVESHPIEVEAVLPEEGTKLIDNVEKVILELNKEAIRQAASTYLEELSKKVLVKQRDQNGVIQTNSSKHRVDGEIGRFKFTTHRLN